MNKSKKDLPDLEAPICQTTHMDKSEVVFNAFLSE